MERSPCRARVEAYCAGWGPNWQRCGGRGRGEASRGGSTAMATSSYRHMPGEVASAAVMSLHPLWWHWPSPSLLLLIWRRHSPPFSLRWRGGDGVSSSVLLSSFPSSAFPPFPSFLIRGGGGAGVESLGARVSRRSIGVLWGVRFLPSRGTNIEDLAVWLRACAGLRGGHPRVVAQRD